MGRSEVMRTDGCKGCRRSDHFPIWAALQRLQGVGEDVDGGETGWEVADEKARDLFMSKAEQMVNASISNHVISVHVCRESGRGESNGQEMPHQRAN